MTLTVTTGEFTGPLELLYKLIQEKKLPINEISLSKVCDDYVQYVKDLERMHYQQSTYFLVIAATLLFIKSKSLLPTLATFEDEDKSIDDLEQRLALYTIFVEITESLEPLLRRNSIFFPHYVPKIIVFAPGNTVQCENLRESLQYLVERTPLPVEHDTTMIDRVIHISEMIERIHQSLTVNKNVSFRSLTGYQSGVLTQTEKINIIVGFLALLEMTRDGLLVTLQDTAFADINIVEAFNQ